MTATKPVMKMPELLIFARYLAIGLVGTEVFRVAFYLGTNFTATLSNLDTFVIISGILIVTLLCLIYLFKRGAHLIAARMCRSYRIDLLATCAAGIWSNELALPWLDKAHSSLKNADPQWAPALLLLLCAVLFSPLLQQYWPRRKTQTPQMYFIADEEISDENEDLLANKTQAKSFAETVLASGAHPGVGFGVDGPWGVGKTSFIDLAEGYWANAGDSSIVGRF